MSLITPGLSARTGASMSSYRRRPSTRHIAVVATPILLVVAAVVVFQWRSQAHAADAAARSALESGIGLLALAGTALLVASLRRTRRLRDLWLLAALGVATLIDLAFNVPPTYRIAVDVQGYGARTALLLVGSLCLLATSLSSGRRLRAGDRRRSRAVVLTALGLVAAGEAVNLIAGPVATTGARGRLEPVAVVVTLITCASLMLAAVEFLSWRGRANEDAELLAGAALLALGGSLCRLALPAPRYDWLTLADALRAGFFLLMLTVAIRLYRRVEGQLAHEAVVEERLRIAHDLHDGLAQDLAFIAAYADRLASAYGADHPVAIAAARALAASRGRIIDLEAVSAPTAEAALRELADEFRERYGVDVVIDASAGAEELDGDERRELVRIAREGIANAVRHGGARTIRLTLGPRSGGTLLSVADDGCGIAEAGGASAGTGLGLRAMRDRASRLGARLRVGDSAAGGTEVTVTAAQAPDAVARRRSAS